MTLEKAHTVASPPAEFDAERQRRLVRRVIDRGSFCTIATSSAANRPHASGLLYVSTSRGIVMTTFDDSVKARNVRENPRVAVSIAVTKLPFVPPFAVQFQTSATVVGRDDELVRDLLAGGELKTITSHGELDHPDTVFLYLRQPERAASYGVGVPLLSLARAPLSGARSVSLR